MMLRDIEYKPYYSKSKDNISKEFYLPSLASSIRYDRATGYFGSTVYILAWSCLKEFIKNGGKIRIICSPYLAEQDQSAIDEGMKALESKEARESLFIEFQEIFGKDSIGAPERALACMISQGILEIKIAVGKYDPERLFHDKVGVFFDSHDSVAFRGSINETFKGISDDGNFESFDVFTSWGSKNDIERLIGIETEFESIWNNHNPNIIAFDLPDSIQTIVSKHANKVSRWEEAIDEVTQTIDEAKEWSADKTPNGRRPRNHQLKALKNWDKAGRKGILEHATGSGKTFTAMCAIRKELEIGHPVLILVPSIGLLEQWKDDLDKTITELGVKYLLCGGGHNSWKSGSVLRSFTRPNVTGAYRITISTMGTASSNLFLSLLCCSEELFVVADEVHRMGSQGNQNFFSVLCGSRLGLSATPRRYGDKNGTESIINFFGDIIRPPYTLKNAIDDGVLCKYFYHPHVVSLREEEQKEWDDLSKQISKEYARAASTMDSENILGLNRIKQLLIKRSRIVKSAENKIDLAKEIISKYYQDGQRWIVYCDDQEQMNVVLEALLSNDVRAYAYHSELTKEERNNTLKYFTQIGGVVVSIRCLDEGIDIPATTHALILASSQNPREFIQRRGRILRNSLNKYHAYLFDAIVIPDNFYESDSDTRIIETELSRSIQFGLWSIDQKCISDLKCLAIDHNIDFEHLTNTGIEYE